MIRIGIAALLLTLSAAGARAQSADPEVQTFRGSGSGATPLFVLPEGMIVAEADHGSASFVAFLVDDRGNVVGQLGTNEQSVALRIPRSARYLFDVRAEGDWAIRLTGGDASVSSRRLTAAGELEGRAAARQGISRSWLGGGFAGGLLLGPVGTAFAVARAHRSDVEVPSALQQGLAGQDPLYSAAFQQAYREGIISGRRTSALVGGITGTAVLAFVVLQMTVWGDGGTGEKPPPPPEQTNRMPLIRFVIPTH